MWQIAVELKTLFPQIPLIGDPSHMAGKRAYLAELTQRAMDLNYDGLIIESHRNPDEAWSDASQQLTPNALAEMLSNIEFRKATYESDFQSELERLRQRLDNLDRELLEVLASRMSVVEQLGEYKEIIMWLFFNLTDGKQCMKPVQNGLKVSICILKLWRNYSN